jgi:hypothetical protein
MSSHLCQNRKADPTLEASQPVFAATMSLMGDSGLSINLGDSLPYLEQRFLEMIGKDAASKEAAAWLSNLQTTAIIQARHVYCVGMHAPLPFESIYQPTRLRVAGADEASKSESFYHHDEAIRSMLEGRRLLERSVSTEDFLADSDNAIIYAGPGWGKTTFLHHIFRLYAQSKTVLPILITLRRPSAVDDLERLASSKIENKTKGRILLLVDGYDELSVYDRRRVSEALLKYQALQVGNFLLSCREYYQVLARVAGSTDRRFYTRRQISLRSSVFGGVRIEA